MKIGNSSARRKTLLQLLFTFTLLAQTSCATNYGQGPIILDSENPSSYMKGIPPTSDKIVGRDLSWARNFEKARWSHQNITVTHNVDVISRGAGPIAVLPYANKTIVNEGFSDVDGKEKPLVDLLRRLNTNGFIVLKKGKIVAELYFNGFGPDKRHQMNSATKSLVGMLVGTLASEGVLDLNESFSKSFPELKDSGVADGNLQNALDMTLGVDWPMGWEDINTSYRLQTFAAAGFIEVENGPSYANTLELIATAPKIGEHGALFAYQAVNTEMLGWSISKATGENWQNALSTRIWSRLGAERDAFIIVDKGGHGFAAAGMNATLRDIARFGLMIENNGYYNGQQIVPASWVFETVRGNSQVKAAMQSQRELNSYDGKIFYHNQFRVFDNGDGELFATGGIGQKIYINQKHDLVGVFFATEFDRTDVVHQIHLMQQIRDRLAE